MPIASNTRKTWPYILNADREEYAKQKEAGGVSILPPTVFHLRTLTNGEKAEVEDLLFDVFKTEGITPEKMTELKALAAEEKQAQDVMKRAKTEDEKAAAAWDIATVKQKQGEAMMITADPKAMLRANRLAAVVVCKYGIAGWDRLYDEDGVDLKPVHIGRTLNNDALDVVIPYADELAIAIQSKNRVDLEDLKKSVPAL